MRVSAKGENKTVNGDTKERKFLHKGLGKASIEKVTCEKRTEGCNNI